MSMYTLIGVLIGIPIGTFAGVRLFTYWENHHG